MDLPTELQLQAQDLYVAHPVFGELRKCLNANKPESPQPEDALHVQTAKAFLRSGYEQALREMESLCIKKHDNSYDEMLAIAHDQKD